MKTLIALVLSFSAQALADVPSDPALYAIKLKSENLLVVYGTMSAKEEVISDTGKFPDRVITTRKVQRDLKFGTTREGEIRRAMICTKAAKPSYSGFVTNKVECIVVNAVNMKLPETVEELLKVKIEKGAVID